MLHSCQALNSYIISVIQGLFAFSTSRLFSGGTKFGFIQLSRVKLRGFAFGGSSGHFEFGSRGLSVLNIFDCGSLSGVLIFGYGGFSGPNSSSSGGFLKPSIL